MKTKCCGTNVTSQPPSGTLFCCKCGRMTNYDPGYTVVDSDGNPVKKKNQLSRKDIEAFVPRLAEKRKGEQRA